jgi:hypothetical protein
MAFDPDPPRKWKRRSYDESKFKGLSPREVFELEAQRDMEKDIEQLVCDVHEETHSIKHPDPTLNGLLNLSAAQKRFASLMGRVALSNDKVARQMLWLTGAILLLTAAIVLIELLKK